MMFICEFWRLCIYKIKCDRLLEIESEELFFLKVIYIVGNWDDLFMVC